MKTVGELLNEHPFYKARLHRLHKRAAGLAAPGSSLSSSDALHLEAYVLNRPERFFHRDCFAYVADLLAQQPPTSLPIPGNITTDAEVNEALLALRRANRQLGDPARESYINDRQQHVLREEVLPDFARLAEEVYSPLVGYIAELRALASGKPYKPLAKDKDFSPLRNRWERAKRWLPVGFHDCFHPNIRNSIVHATLLFEPYEVRFRDPSGPDILVPLHRAEGLAADLLDVCNGIAAALTLHSCTVERTTGKVPSLEYFHTQRIIASSDTDLLHNESCFESLAAGEPQIQVHGSHAHWRHENLLFDLMRTMVYAHHYFPAARRIFVSYQDHRRAPTFFGMPVDFIPTLDAPSDRLSVLSSQFGKQGGMWIEHEGILAALASKLQGIGSVLNWLQAVPVSMHLGAKDEPDYELREFIDVSVGFRERFRAIIVSDPRPQDLEEDGTPTKRYLQFLFNESQQRWLLRRSQVRPLGAGRLRVLQCAIIEVHRADRRLRKLRDNGLQENFLFRFEWGIGTTPSIALYGSTLQRVGFFTVTVNTRARPFLQARASGVQETPS